MSGPAPSRARCAHGDRPEHTRLVPLLRGAGRVLVAALVLALAAPDAAAQELRGTEPASGPRAGRAGVPRKVARAFRVEGPAPHVDGRLDDAAWRQAETISDFVQKEPVEGAEPSVRTEVAILYDADAVYVGARMFGDPSAIQAPLTRRDNGGGAEHLWVSLDTYFDRRTAYSFGVSAAGTRMDAYHPRDSENNRDSSWDPVWEAKVRIDSLGWTAEMRIPFSQLRFNDRPVQVWGMNLDRWIPARNEDIYWIPVPRNETGWSSRMGQLTGIESIRPPRRFELIPYVSGDAMAKSGRDPANPFTHAVDASGRAGGDLKMGLGPNLTLEGTVNSDFGQVEADPAEVNLSAFETFFGERRPFFTEGSQLLRGDGPGYFYSRRIGAAPRGDADGDFVDRPRSTTILGATKLSGRLASGLSVGGLAAVTAREYARTYDSAFVAYDSVTGRFDTAAAARGSVEVAPPSAYGVLRGRQEFGPWTSTAGFILTAVRRDLARGEPLADVLAREAYSGGGDFNLRFRGGEYEVGGWAGFSYVAGDSLAMVRVQQSSARYFQRPDAGYLRLDSSRTSLFGYTAALRAARVSGRHWLWEVSGGLESPGLELNDIGQVRTADGVNVGASLRYRESRPGRVFRNYSVGIWNSAEWNFGWDAQAADTRVEAQATLTNYWNGRLRFDRRSRVQDERLTRGGPSMGRGRGWSASFGISSNHSAPTRVSVNASTGRDELSGRSLGVSGGLSFQPGTRWQVSLNPGYSRGVDPRQYFTTLDGGPAATYGRRYVFASIERSTLSAQLRLSYTFTPDLTLEAYAEPFATSGRYSDHGELAAPRSREIRRYDPVAGPVADSLRAAGTLRLRAGADTLDLWVNDFNVRSFRSNVVLRWEWRAGSTLYLVWQQNRSARTSSGALVRPGSIWDALSSPGDNFFAVKLSYWLPVG